jgi:hypothetical protein
MGRSREMTMSLPRIEPQQPVGDRLLGGSSRLLLNNRIYIKKAEYLFCLCMAL